MALADPEAAVEQARLDQDYLKKCADMGSARLAAYSLAEQYYEGDQRTELTDRAKQYLERSGLPYQENFCETVVDALVDRLSITGVSVTGAKDEGGDLGKWLWDVWDRNRMDGRQRALWHNAALYGDGFLLVDYDSRRGLPRFTRQVPSRTYIEYGDEGAEWASKCWTTDAVSAMNPTGMAVNRLNVYYPNRVEKYYRVGKINEDTDWAMWQDEGDQTWPLPWADAAGEPLGIPIFHLPNRSGTTYYGQSEIRGVIPQQDRLNKELVDLSMVLDTLGYPQRYAIGVDNTADLKTAPGEVWSVSVAGASFGQFASADPSGPLAAIEATLLRIAARSRTPAHLLVINSGGAPSGEALKTAESGLVRKAAARQVAWGDPLAEAFVLAVRLAIVYQMNPAPPIQADAVKDLYVNVSWSDPETRNEKEHLESLGLMKDLGVSQRTILTRIPGVDPEQEAMQRAEEAAAGAAAFGSFMNSGGADLGAPVMPEPGLTGGV